mgnify:CR=1 FL=1
MRVSLFFILGGRQSLTWPLYLIQIRLCTLIAGREWRVLSVANNALCVTELEALTIIACLSENED